MTGMRQDRYPVAVTITLEPTSRNPAAHRRRLRAGGATSGHDARGTVPTQVRNGLPLLRPYVYNGTGYDQYEGTYGDPWLDSPYDHRPRP